jgi:HSP20 family molecular chaperone IbpA
LNFIPLISIQLEEQIMTDQVTARNGSDQRTVYRPPVDIIDTASDVLLVADVPGVDEAHLDVTLDKNVLTIHGTVTPPSFEGKTPVRMEYGVGDFERVFTVTDDVNRDGIEATVKDGVLHVKLPKSAQSARRKINVATR